MRTPEPGKRGLPEALPAHSSRAKLLNSKPATQSLFLFFILAEGNNIIGHTGSGKIAYNTWKEFNFSETKQH